MIWVSYRQFRGQGRTAVVLLIIAAALCLFTGFHMHHVYHADLSECAPQGDCTGVLDQFRQDFNTALNTGQVLVMAVPALIGMFWGAPLIGRELESGTDQLAWNQSVTRSRWLASKTICVGIIAILTAGLLSYLLTWWAGPLDHITGSRFAPTTFDSRDVVPIAYAAFAFTLGTALGLFMRRTIPAMALTLTVFVLLQILVPHFVRPNLLPSTTTTVPVNAATGRGALGIYGVNGGASLELQLPITRGAWVISAPPIETASGHVATSSGITRCAFTPAPATAATSGHPTQGGPSISTITGCLARYHLHDSVTYQPADHYWPLQWLESGLYVLLTLALSGFCFWFIRRA